MSAPISIFFDLETSDLLKVGQILNFCFLAVDPDWKVIDKLIGTVKVSPLQLPRVSAVLANRTNVLEHQKTAQYTEREALKKIEAFIKKYANQSSKLPLIGYNSERFDIGYLRTSFLRNAIHPYLTVATKDLINVSRSLLLTNKQFRAEFCKQETPNFKLETLCKLYKLLDGPQKHESEADVDLTIKLAETYLKLHGIDVRSYEPYQLLDFHNKSIPIIVSRPITKEYKVDEYSSSKIMVHLKGTEKASLWIDLEKFKKAKTREKKIEAVSRYKMGEPLIGSDSDESLEPFYDLAKTACEELAEITEDDIYPENKAYIEEWIYRLNPKEMTRFIRIIDGKEEAGDVPDDIRILMSRYRLDSISDEAGYNTEALKDSYERYVKYRYGGKMIIEESRNSKETKPIYHPTFKDLYNEIIECEKKLKAQEDLNIVNALKSFYENSLISKIFE